MNINTLRVEEGKLAPRAERLVIEWAKQHRRELKDAWHRAEHLD